MAVLLKNLYSIINGKADAKDAARSFTFIEFIKEFGYNNSSSSFLNDYKSYLSLWANVKKNDTILDDKEFVKESLIDTLKSIALNYSSYEEQDFLANIDWNNEMHQKAIVPFFAEKIKNICDFYKNKRQEAHLIINKNSFKGSRTSLEQIIYDKIIDFYFENRNLKPQIDHLQHNLTISIEEYIDIYSEYFDIPRNKKCTDKSRAELIEANINNVNYEDYIEVSKVISDTLFGGEMYLEEIPLIAQVGLDLSQKCAGDVSTLRDVLLAEATINQVSLGDQIALRRKLYEKYLGCDLYYIYCANKNEIYIDILTRAENPSGNLLNCGTADTAVVESDRVKLLSNIGLFFKPDKTGILKVNANDFSWEIDKTKLTDDTFYVFPNPNKYGDIGNNKSPDYPLIYEYKLNDYIKNISSGWAKDDPLAYISATTWNTYYTKQDDDYILNDNKDFNYSFTSLANLGIISNYQTDLFGNEYALIKGFESKDGVLEVPSKFKLPEVTYEEGNLNMGDITVANPTGVLLNGGYFKDPLTKDADVPFNYNKRIRLANDYIWSGVVPQENKFTTPDAVTTHIDLGSFTDKVKTKYIDHYSETITAKSRNGEITEPLTKTSNMDLVLSNFLSKVSDKKIQVVDKSFEDIAEASGILYTKTLGVTENHGIEVIANDVNNFAIINDILIIERDKSLMIYNQNINNGKFNIYINMNFENSLYKVLYNESKEAIYIAELIPVLISDSYKHTQRLHLKIYRFDLNIKNHIPELLIDTSSDEMYEDNFELNAVHNDFTSFVFTYNNDLDVYLIAYLLNDNSDHPTLYEHKFRLFNKERFYKTLTTSVYSNVNDKINIFNIDLETSFNNDLFFVPYNG